MLYNCCILQHKPDHKLDMSENTTREFRRILRLFERELNIQNQSSCCCGVTVTQCHTLLELEKNDHNTLNELTTKLHLDNSTVSLTVETLVKGGLLYRTIPPDNRRITIISLTQKGRSVCRTINEGNDKYYSEALKEIPDDKLQEFLRWFESLTLGMYSLNN